MTTPEISTAVDQRVIPGRRFWESRLVFPILILLIVAGFYWKLTLTKQYDWLWGPDLAQQVLPWFEEQARQVQHSSLPLWDGHEWAGQPMIGQAQPGTAYPLNWILFLVPRSHGHIKHWALQWYFIVMHFMAALFCYLLCRDLERSRGAALLGGLVFSLGGYAGTTDWPQMLNGAVWAPLVFLFQLRAIRGRSPLGSAAFCGACLGMAWLAGHHQVPIYLTLTMSGIWLYFMLRDGRVDWGVVKLAGVSFVFMFLVGALQILPAQEYGHLAKRWAGVEQPLAWNQAVPYTVHQEYSLGLTSLFAIIFPGLARHADPFIGVVAFSLVLLGVALAWRHMAVRLFALLAIAAIVYSFGTNSVFQGFLYGLVPMVEKARVPSMAVIIFNVSAAVLAAYGADHFSGSADTVWGRHMTRGLLGFGLVLYLLILGTLFLNKSLGTDDRIMLAPTAAILLAALLYGWRLGNLSTRQAFTLLTLLMLLELGNDSGYTLPHSSNAQRNSYMEQVRGNADIAEFIQRQPGVFRVEAPTEKLSPSWGTYHNFDGVRTLGASVTSNILELEWHTWQSRLLLGVRYTVSEKPPLDESRDIFTGASGLKVYENPSAFPRVWAVHTLVGESTPGAVRSVINDHLEQLHIKAFLSEKVKPLPACNAADQVSFKNYAAERVTVDAQMGCEGMVVLADTYFPGWKAWVDGKPARIYQVDNALRGVLVPRGKHEVVMAYRPAPVYFGALLTGLGWLSVMGLAVFWKGK